MPAHTKPSGRGPGRPRDANVDEAVLEATREILMRDGYEAVSVEGVARAAGVGKASVYRRWGSKTELVIAATADFARPEAEESLDDQLAAFIRVVVRDFSRPEMRAALPGFVAEALRDPTKINELLVDPDLDVLTDSVRKARRDGEVHPDVDAGLLFDLYAGAAFLRSLRTGKVTDGFGRKLLTFLQRGMAPTE